MNQSEKHKFEEEWEQMFESASETPPPSVWDAIEKRLDGEDTPVIVPLVWWKNPKIAYAVAAAVALLLVSWPILQLTREGSDSAPQVATRTMPADSPEAASTPGSTLYESPQAQESLARAEDENTGRQNTAASRTRSRSAQQSSESTAGNPLLTDASGTENASGIENTETGPSGKNRLAPAESEAIALTIPTVQGMDASGQTGRNASPAVSAPVAGTPADGRTPTLSETMALLSPVGVSEVPVYVQKRYVFYQRELTEPDITPPVQSKEYWAGVGIMPASFNPGVSVTSPPAAFSMARASRQSLSNASKAGLSYAVQMQTGMKLAKHWTIETGLSYLQGNSTFESDGYVLDASTNRSANVLEGALLANTSTNKENAFGPSTSQDMNTAAVYIDLDQKTSNDYRFMQVPVQAGYVLNPDGKVNYTILGGPVANLFLRNEIESGSGSSFVNTAEDGLYRSLSWSAATGVRLNYRLSDHWSANLTGSYQKSLTSSLRSGTSLEARPQLYGVAWGVRYVF